MLSFKNSRCCNFSQAKLRIILYIYKIKHPRARIIKSFSRIFTNCQINKGLLHEKFIFLTQKVYPQNWQNREESVKKCKNKGVGKGRERGNLYKSLISVTLISAENSGVAEGWWQGWRRKELADKYLHHLTTGFFLPLARVWARLIFILLPSARSCRSCRFAACAGGGGLGQSLFLFRLLASLREIS